MRKLLLFISVSLISSLAISQGCVHTIPATAIVKQNDNAHVQDADAIWMCEDRVVDVQGNDNILYIEKNADVTISGNRNKIYAKTGSTITITGDMNEITHDSTGVNYTDNGTNTTVVKVCNPGDQYLKFEYDNVSGTTGCIDTSYTGVRSVKQELGVTLYPNPVSTVLNVTMHKKNAPTDYNIYSISGKLVLSGRMIENPQQIDLSTLDKGLYFIELQSGQGKISRRISVE